MKVGMITHWFDPEGGAAAGPGTIARAIQHRGHEVSVLTGYPIYPEGKVFDGYRVRPYKKESIRGVAVHRVPAYPSHDDNAARRMANYLSYSGTSSVAAPAVLGDADVAFVYSSPATAATAAIPLKLLRGIPFVIQIQDLWPDTVSSSGFVTDSTGSAMDRVLNYYCNAIYRHAAHIAVISPGMAALLQDRGVPSDKISVIPNWAEESSFYPTEKNPRLAASLGLNRRFTVMYAGNHGEMQNLDIVIDAAARLLSRRDIGFALVGAGVRKDALRRRSADLGLDNVAFIDPQPFSSMAQVLALGDAQLVSLKDVPLYRVTMPSKIQANMAAARPIIAAVAGDAAAVVIDADCGATARPGNVGDLVNATLAIADASPDRRAELSRNSRQAYLDRFSEQRVGDSLVELLEAHRRPRRIR